MNLESKIGKCLTCGSSQDHPQPEWVRHEWADTARASGWFYYKNPDLQSQVYFARDHLFESPRRDVLDHGYVQLIDIMGDDIEPARAARVSYGKYDEDRAEEKDLKLAAYLLNHSHTSPFEQVILKWEMKLPIFVARQIIRHRTASVNEFSMRYAEPSEISNGEDIEFYTPHFRTQSTSNKQSSDKLLNRAENRGIREEYVATVLTAVDTYYNLIDKGVSRELARCVLPVSVYTKWVWTNDLHNTFHFLKLRLHEGAQWETRMYAEAMLKIMKLRLPHLTALWLSRYSEHLQLSATS